jgi:hypothetical protein
MVFILCGAFPAGSFGQVSPDTVDSRDDAVAIIEWSASSGRGRHMILFLSPRLVTEKAMTVEGMPITSYK